ncbi:unnamed protein product [Lupinus luteus]|uniref:RNase H type-1 domain-containing protein n=1 Tax=Lupinus luteus TaxID=3873 RepID=A0AAV1YHW8_LUPLU
MGGGGVLRDSKGQWISGFSANYGEGTSILAELLAIEKNVVLESECLEDVHIIYEENPFRIASILSLINKIRSWLALSWVVKVCFVNREANMVADFMAKLGSHSLHVMKIWDSIPTDCQPLLQLDISLIA